MSVVRRIVMPVVRPLVRAITEAYGALFSPKSLFANNEVGVWYDPSDLSTLYQDASGTTPVTAVEQPVGLMLDKSKGLVLGSEATSGAWLNGYTTTFDTFSSTGPGSFTATTTGAKIPRTRVDVSIPAAGWYVLRFTATFSGGTFTTSGPAASGSPYSPAIGITMPSASGVAFTTYFYATGPFSSFVLNWNATGASTLSVTGVSVRELPGNHAYQTTSTKRPVLSARVNLLTYSEQFDNAAWTKTNSTVTANATTAPDGTLTADKLVENTTASVSHNINQTTTLSTTGYVCQVYAKSAGRTRFVVRRVSTSTVSFNATFDLTNATVSKTGDTTATIVSVGDGWFKCVFTITHTSDSAGGFYIELVNESGAVTYTGDGTSGIYIWGADLRVANVGVGLPAYQRVNTATDYDTVGFPLYLKGDSVSGRAMVTNTITPGTDKLQLFTGVRKLTDAAQAVVSEYSSTIASNNGSFLLSAPNSAAANYNFSSKGTTQVDNTVTTYAAPRTDVLTALGDIAGDSNSLQVGNNASVAVTTDQGTGNYGNFALNLFARNAAGAYFNGNLYGYILRFGPNLSSGVIDSAKKYIATKAGVTL